MSQSNLPDYLKQGEPARLFPVLSTTSKEGRTTSIVLACLSKIEEFGTDLLSSVGQRVGKRSKIETYTEIVCAKASGDMKDRPDGLISVTVGSRRWRALVEAKVGNSELSVEQIERYRVLAKENGIDCVISISNQFATSPDSHPLEEVRKSRSKIPVFHWSWMHILTTADVLISKGDVADMDQLVLLNELRRFLSHESAGVKGFERMPKEWSEVNRLVSSGGTLAVKSPLVEPVMQGWHQETRDLALILSRMTGTLVKEKLPRKHIGNPAQRQKDESAVLCSASLLECQLDVQDAAAPIVVTADIPRRSIDVGMSLRAPEDKVSTKARVNWLLRQISSTETASLYVRLLWPGASEPTQHAFDDLVADVEIATTDKAHLAPHGFFVFYSERLGAKFAQQTNFISEIERIVPKFYGEVGTALTPYQRKAPKIKEDRESREDVTPKALASDAEEFGV